ncbi:MAG: hypothetical protein WCB18_06940 [Thermoplasmata archaeon]
MTAFHEDRMVGHIVDALQRLGGMATLEQIEGQVSRSGAVQLPPAALDLVVRLTLRANQNGRGLGCFSEVNHGSFGLTSSLRPSGGPKPTEDVPVRPTRPTPPF